MVFTELHRCADMVLSELIGDQSVLSDVNCKGMSCGGGGGGALLHDHAVLVAAFGLF